MNEEIVKLFGVNLEGRLNFDFHVNGLLKKAIKKYHALARVCNHMNKKKQCILMNTFIKSQVSYYPLVGGPIVGLWTMKLIKFTKKF